MKIFGKINDRLNKTEDAMVGIIMLVTSFMILINVILRYVFRSGIRWSDEMVRYLMILLTFVGCSICVRTGTHISVDLLLTVLKSEGRGKKILQYFIYLVGLLFSLLIAYFGVQIVTHNIANPQLSPALQIPMYIPYLSIVIGFGLSVIRYLQLLLKNNRKGL